MLDFRITQTGFTFGLSEGSDPHQVPFGTLTTCENVVWKKNGKLEKRAGTTTIPKATIDNRFASPVSSTLSSVSKLFTRLTRNGAEELICIGNGNLYSYSGANSKWTLMDAASGLDVGLSTLVDSTNGVVSSDLCVSTNGVMVHAWIEGDGFVGQTGKLFMQSFDINTGATLQPPRQLNLSGTANPHTWVRVVPVGSDLVIVTAYPAGTSIVAYVVSGTTGLLTNSGTLRNDVKAASGWYFDAVGIGSTFAIVYSDNTPNLKLYSYNISLAQQQTATVSAVATSTMAIDATSGENLYVAYMTGATIKMAVHNPSTLAQTVAPFTVETFGGPDYASRIGMCRIDASNELLVYSKRNTLGVGNVTEGTVSYSVTSAGTVTTTSQRLTWGVSLITRPFKLGTKYYAAMTDHYYFGDSTYSGTNTFPGTNSMLFEIETFNPGVGGSFLPPHRYAGKIDHLLGGYNGVAESLPANAISYGGAFYFSTPFYASSAVGAVLFTALRQGIRLVSASSPDLTSGQWSSATVNGEAYVLDGGLCAYDGNNFFDYGFSRAPIFRSISSAANTAIVGGVYQYSVHQEYRSDVGILHQGPTKTVQMTAATNPSRITFVFAHYNVSRKHTFSTGFATTAGPGGFSVLPILIPVYRSTVGATGAYYRLTHDPTFNMCTPDLEAVTTTFIDQRADADTGGGVTLASRPQIYTNGGELDDIQPPISIAMFYGVNRLWLLAADACTWWFSKSFQDNFGVAPGFSANFRIVFDSEQVAGAQMDEKLIFFGRKTISYMLGEGPVRTGQGSDFTTPKKLQTDVGCTNPRSVISTPDGLMFLSERGIYLLTRGLEAVWIGRPVVDQLAAYPTVTSAVLVPSQNQVRFTCNASDGLTGIVLCYDLVEKQWSTLKYTDVTAGTFPCPIASAVMWNGAWTFVTPSGNVYQESTSDYRDGASTWVPVKIETAWYSAAGPVTYQAVRRFMLQGISNTNHDLKISVGFDGESTYDETQAQRFVAGYDKVTDIGPFERCQVTIGNRRKCSSIRFKIEDFTPGNSLAIGNGQGPSFEMMGVEVGLKKGMPVVPASMKG